ncbi:MAG: CBS domain-containing protein, partial [Burkholderiales bacterium]|nr:CBS domain-containing protein [Burkholderiales bacterium]
NLATIETTEHARFPVMRGGPENILGVVNARKLLARAVGGGVPDVAAHLDPPLYVPETLTGMELLDNFRASGGQVAFVVDEYGAVQGMVTLQDLIEAITGEFNPRDPATSWAVQREDGSWLLDGLIPLQELKDRLGLASTPEEDRGRYHTLSGMVMFLTGRLPKIGDAVEWQEWRFEIVDMDGKKIDRVLATRTVGAAVAVEDGQPT